jgi:hypothetical protein
MAVSNP